MDSRCCKDCKVIPEESVTTQHRVVVLDICIKRWKEEILNKETQALGVGV